MVRRISAIGLMCSACAWTVAFLLGMRPLSGNANLGLVSLLAGLSLLADPTLFNGPTYFKFPRTMRRMTRSQNVAFNYVLGGVALVVGLALVLFTGPAH